jgi:hypothetical protein
VATMSPVECARMLPDLGEERLYATGAKELPPSEWASGRQRRSRRGSDAVTDRDATMRKEGTMADDAVNLLWTGGWDSTFRLLELVLVHGRRVQPYYIVYSNRASMQHEFRAMTAIRRLIAERDDAIALILPRAVIVADDIAPDPDLRKKFAALRALGHLGGQYEWLARVAKHHETGVLELSVHVDDKAAAFLEGKVRMVQDGTPRGSWELRPEYADTPLDLFRYFRFPLLPLTKVEMQEIAREHGFSRIMEKTRFCHSRLSKPCGVCLPCQFALSEGMGHRIPRFRRTRVHRLHLRTAQLARRAIHQVAKRI